MVTETTQQMTDRRRSWEEQQETFDISSEMMRLTLQIVGRAFLSIDLTGQAEAISRSTTIINERLGTGLTTFLPWLPTVGNLRFRRAAVSLRSVILQIVSERRHHRSHHNDLLSMLLDASDDEAGEVISDAKLRDLI